MPKEIITIRVDPELVTRLDALAAKTEETRSAVAERALRDGLGSYEGWVESFNNPIVRDVFARLLSSPKSFKLLAGVLGEDVNDEQADALANRVNLLRRKAGVAAPGERKSRLKVQGG